MKITRATVAAGAWCCNTMKDYSQWDNCFLVLFEYGYIEIHFMGTDEIAYFCPFCGERLEVEA